MIKKTQTFVSEVRAEMQKVTWPTRPELIESTGVVLTTMLIISTFIGIADLIFSRLVQQLMR